MLSLWTALLRTEPMLFTDILQLLDLLDSLSLMVYALEFDDQAAMSAIRDHSPLFPFIDEHVIRFAVVHGCFRALYSLRKNRGVACGLSYKAHRTELSDAVTDDNCGPRNQLMRWLSVAQILEYRLPEGTMYEAATLGDLDVIKWIHATRITYRPFLEWLAEKAQSADYVYTNIGGRGIQIDVTVPFDAELGIFAWCSSDAEFLRRSNQSARQPLHRVGFAFQGTDAKCVVSLKIARGWADLEKLHDPVVFAAEEGNIELLEVLKRSRNKYQWAFSQKTLVQAVAKGHLTVLQWLLGNKVVPDEDISVAELVTTAMEAQQLDILRWLDASFAIDQVPYESVRSTVIKGHLAVMKWVYERFPTLPANQDLVDPRWQYRYCCADVAMWLHKSKGLPLNPLMLAGFVKHGDVALLKVFLDSFATENSDKQPLITGFMFEEACHCGSIEMVQYLAEHGVWSPDGMTRATQRDNFAIMKWLFSTGQPCSFLLHAALKLMSKGETELATSFAARLPVDHRESNIWRASAAELRRPPPEYYSHFIYGHRYRRRLMVKSQLEWTLALHPASLMHHNSLGSWAAQNGYTIIVRQLIAGDYPNIFSKANLRRLLSNSRDGDLVQVFLTRRPELLRNRMFYWAAKYKQVKLLRFLFALTERDGNESTKDLETRVYIVIKAATKYGHLGVLKWVHSKAVSPTRTLMNPSKCAQYGHVHILKWLHKSTILDERKLAGAMQTAVKFAQLSVLRWYEGVLGLEYSCSLQELKYAAQHCDADVVTWILRKQPELMAGEGELSRDIELLLKEWGAIAEFLKRD